VALNVRLTPEAASALRAEAERTGRSQQEIAREAIGRHLHLIQDDVRMTDRERARSAGSVRPARVRYRKVKPRLQLPKDSGSLDLPDRSDRF
jgi:predicted DNA-binding protein